MMESNVTTVVSRKQRLKRLVVLLNLILIAVLLAGFAYYGNPGQMLAILGTAEWPWFAAALIAGLCSSFLSSTRLWLLIRKQQIRISLGELFSINLGVRFYSFFSPLSSVGSIMRWIRLVPEAQAAQGFAALAANRFFDIVVPLSMGGLWAFSSWSTDSPNPWLILAYLVGLVAVVWLLLRFSEPVRRKIEELQEGATSRLIGTGLRAAGKLLESLGTYRSLSTREAGGLIGIAVLSDIIGLLTHLLVARSINLPLAFTDLGWIRATMMLVALAPFTLPGGFGLREVSAIVLVNALGVDLEHATAYSLLLYTRMLITALIGGVLELVVNLRTIRTGFST